MIKIEISADTTGEALQHIIELANGLLGGTSQVQHDPVMSELREPPAGSPVVIGNGPHELSSDQIIDDKPKRTRRTKEQIAADEAAAKAVEENVDETTDSDTLVDAEETPDTTTAAESTSDAPTLDFDKDVAPVVLGLVKSRGKPWVVDILSHFGVTRASELPPEQFGELITALEDADAA